MVIVQLNGGLGNQMFQYALGRSIAERLSTVVKLDLSTFESNQHRRYGLHSFNIWEHIATEQEIEAIKGRKYTRKEALVLRTCSRLGFRPATDALLSKGRVLRERHLHFDSEVLNATGSLYVEGYWQSEKYFKDIRDILLREFTIKHGHDPQSQKLSETIQSTNSVSLHVRRGDYVHSKTAAEVLGFCGLDYYERSIDHILENVPAPHFLVFSDEPDWAKENIRTKCPTTFVDHNNTSRDYEDLRLMSMCQHHIISNSSYSWWSAWLSRFHSKIVIAPLQWFKNTAMTTADLIPEAWLRL